ncbi:hypothetical protein [Paenibacillus rhizovicinus]|uniref:hypothetical protein n=1 Tax=Paenibacillus rhizovicinus TaxID=2704463 RepID=UPI00178046EA|nr:hypothetical protein [Paenibacillus rhizovicinus]
MNYPYQNPMNAVSPANAMNPMMNAPFCPDCPEQTVYDPPVTLYEDYYHPQLVNVVQSVEVVKQHHCYPVYHKSCVYSEKDVMVRVSNKRRAKTSSKRAKSRSKKR